MIVGALKGKPQRMLDKEEITQLALAINAPIHFKKVVYSYRKGTPIKMSLCENFSISPILLTDDVTKCTCKKCIGILFNNATETITNLKGENKNEKRIDSDGVRS